MIFKVEHKRDGWTGTLEFYNVDADGFSSSNCYGTARWKIIIDEGEDPEIESFDELKLN